jgi:hypothetical protein
MGNVVAGEAIRMSQNNWVESYVAMQAAIPAHCYDNTRPSYARKRMPNIYGHYLSGRSSDQPYLIDNFDKTMTIAYINRWDYALGKWEVNNRSFKPSSDLNGMYDYYDYDRNLDTYYPNDSFPSEGDVFSYRYDAGPPHRLLVFDRDKYEIFSRCLVSRSRALGSYPVINGFRIIQNLSVWGYDKKPYDHSRQFRSNIAREWPFWMAVVKDSSLATK